MLRRTHVCTYAESIRERERGEGVRERRRERGRERERKRERGGRERNGREVYYKQINTDEKTYHGTKEGCLHHCQIVSWIFFFEVSL